jgi:hypothetical protein
MQVLSKAQDELWNRLHEAELFVVKDTWVLENAFTRSRITKEFTRENVKVVRKLLDKGYITVKEQFADVLITYNFHPFGKDN